MTKIFGDYDQEQLNAQYNQRTLVPDIGPYSKQAQVDTAAARAEFDCEPKVSYGPEDGQWMAVYRAKAATPVDAPILIYFHGGAWLVAEEGRDGQVAPEFVRAGAVFVAPNFSVVPNVSLGDMVRQCREAVAHCYANAASLGGDAARIHVCGHSSGSHLTAMTAVTDWQSDFGLPADVIKGATLVSGPYDLAPVRLSARNEYLDLSAEDEQRLSPGRHLRSDAPPAIFAYGGGELDEFQRQSRVLAAAWEGATGRASEPLVFPGNNHFQMREEYGRAGSTLAQAVLAQMGLKP
ncbi:MAG: alpha/beta hydrolase [Rhodospirillaceae bacterium]|nr:alpha/beta hydrolase [Rhodospirillaceae bacterium]MBT7233192.1 alpha/beta hydrolase [Rhodospirillaceae bacterium]